MRIATEVDLKLTALQCILVDFHDNVLLEVYPDNTKFPQELMNMITHTNEKITELQAAKSLLQTMWATLQTGDLSYSLPEAQLLMSNLDPSDFLFDGKLDQQRYIDQWNIQTDKYAVLIDFAKKKIAPKTAMSTVTRLKKLQQQLRQLNYEIYLPRPTQTEASITITPDNKQQFIEKIQHLIKLHDKYKQKKSSLPSETIFQNFINMRRYLSSERPKEDESMYAFLAQGYEYTKLLLESSSEVA
jgi:hypothetical protein